MAGVAPLWTMLVFEMPPVMFMLAKLGIVTARRMAGFRRYAIVLIVIIAAIITPTTDIVNMCIFAAPMVVLYLISIGVAWFVHPSRRKTKALTR